MHMNSKYGFAGGGCLLLSSDCNFLFILNEPADILPTDDNGDPRFDNLSIMACYDFGVQPSIVLSILVADH